MGYGNMIDSGIWNTIYRKWDRSIAIKPCPAKRSSGLLKIGGS